MRHPRSRVSQEGMSAMRGSCLSIRISIVRDTVPVTSIKAAKLGLGLLLVALGVARADDPDDKPEKIVCPVPEVANGALKKPVKPATNPADEPITIESDDN